MVEQRALELTSQKGQITQYIYIYIQKITY